MGRRMLSLLLLALTLGCRETDDPKGDDTSVGQEDLDGDGWPSDTDCDDLDPTSYPGATEVCDQADNDCNGEVDEGLGTTWYQDADRDGYGSETVTELACEQPAGFVDRAGDCDDTTDTVHVDQVEICDDLDNDCDSLVDEDLGVVWFQDFDLDGYGDSGTFIADCAAPDGFVHDATDCDDKDPAVHPDADELCNEIDDDCDSLIDEAGAVDAPTWYLDYDHDGFGSDIYTVVECISPLGFTDNDLDCDDFDAASYPGGTEYCDEADNDCNGLVDDGARNRSYWYQDSDRDTYGDASSSVYACSAPLNYVSDSTDCDDSNASAYPGATEHCDGEDEDCDGETDEGATDARIWYPDMDLDTWGDSSLGLLSCAAPDGSVLIPGDCDDDNTYVNPDAVEYCDDIDNDCDGGTDEASAADAPTWYQDADGDAYGNPAVLVRSCTQPTNYVLDVTDCDDSAASVNPGADEICNNDTDDNCDGEPAPCTLSLSNAERIFTGQAASDNASGDFAQIGDFNGDGWPDLGVGASYNDGSGTDAGAAYVLFGPFDGSGETSLGATPLILQGEQVNDYAGYRIGGGGDITGDGLDDMIVGAIYESSYRDYAGAGYIVAGPLSGTLSLSSAHGRWTGDSSWDRAGSDATIPGDLDGDGVDDAVIGAWVDSSTASASGTAYVFYGPVDGSGLLSSRPDRIQGEVYNDRLGGVLEPVGDVDGDGLADLLVGVMGNDAGGSEAGAVYVLPGPISGAQTVADHAISKITGREAGDNVGLSVSGVGDFNGDGLDDFAIGARQDDLGASNAGTVYLFYGPSSDGDIDDADLAILGMESSMSFGASIDGGADWDGDGEQDLLVGAHGGGSSGQGAAYLFLGPITGDRDTDGCDYMFSGEATGDSTGLRIVAMERAQADGSAGLWIGAAGNDRTATDAGAVFLLFDLGL